MNQSAWFAHPLQLVLGLTIWAVWFVAIYAGLSVACALTPSAKDAGGITWINAVLLSITAATAGLLLYLSWKCWQQRLVTRPGAGQFIVRTASGLHLLSACATLAVGLPMVGLPPCV